MKNFKPRKNLNHNIYTGCTLLKHLAFASCFMHLHFYNYWTERQYRKKNSEKLWYCSLESVLHAYLCNMFDMCWNFRLLVWCKWIFNCPTPLTFCCHWFVIVTIQVTQWTLLSLVIILKKVPYFICWEHCFFSTLMSLVFIVIAWDLLLSWKKKQKFNTKIKLKEFSTI